jgi:prolyl-tRNA synthetase
LVKELTDADVRVKLDERDGMTPGFKFNDWEMRGVPLRMEIGPKDVAKGSVVLARRDKPGKEGKSFVEQAGITAAVKETLAAIQQSLYDRALQFREAHTKEVGDYDQFKAAIEGGFAAAHWCGNPACEAQIKEQTKATIRCIPFAQSSEAGRCILCGAASQERVIFARAY